MTKSTHLKFPEFHQVAMYCPDHKKAVQSLVMLGYTNWLHDTPLLVDKDDNRIESEMSFCYDFLGNGLELEILTYNSESHRYYEDVNLSDIIVPVISHMGAHVNNADEMAEHYSETFGFNIIHQFDTFNHTNVALAGVKRFREAIIDTRHLFGYNIKFIQRLYHGPWEI